MYPSKKEMFAYVACSVLLFAPNLLPVRSADVEKYQQEKSIVITNSLKGEEQQSTKKLVLELTEWIESFN